MSPTFSLYPICHIIPVFYAHIKKTILRNLFMSVLSCFPPSTVAKIKSDPPWSDLEKEFNDLVTSQLDHCNALYMGTDHAQIHLRQLVQNAARLLAGSETMTSLWSSLLFTLFLHRLYIDNPSWGQDLFCRLWNVVPFHIWARTSRLWSPSLKFISVPCSLFALTVLSPF